MRSLKTLHAVTQIAHQEPSEQQRSAALIKEHALADANAARQAAVLRKKERDATEIEAADAVGGDETELKARTHRHRRTSSKKAASKKDASKKTASKKTKAKGKR